MLRKEQEEEARLAEKLAEQKYQLASQLRERKPCLLLSYSWREVEGALRKIVRRQVFEPKLAAGTFVSGKHVQQIQMT